MRPFFANIQCAARPGIWGALTLSFCTSADALKLIGNGMELHFDIDASNIVIIGGRTAQI